MDSFKVAKKVSFVTIVINIVLAIGKILAGVVGKSSAMIADGFHTLSDVATTVIVLVGIKIANKKADENHPYGHEKYESIFAKLLSLFLLFTGLAIGYESIKILHAKTFVTPGKIALYAAVASIVVKELMYRYTLVAAKKIKSTSMEADAWHHRSDALSSVGTFVGILGARLGFPALDPIAGLIVAALIVKVGVDLYLRAVKELVDESADGETIEKIEHLTRETDGVLNISTLKTRVFGNKIYVDIDIVVDANITVEQGHDIAEKVHDKLEDEIKEIKHCMIHIEPCKEDCSENDRKTCKK